MERTQLKSTRKLFQVDRKMVAFIKFIFEAYDGIAVITTLDPYEAKIELNIAPGCEDDALHVLEDLKHDMIIRSLDD
jgi:hypothetical protein